METVDDAICAGKTHLAVTCGKCRVLHQVPWGLFPKVLGSTRISDIVERLVCKKCGTRPDPETVKPIHPSDGVRFPSTVYSRT